MRIPRLDLAPPQLDFHAAVTLQQQLRNLVSSKDKLPPVRFVAGVDVSYDFVPTRFNKQKKASEWVYAAVVVLEITSLQCVESVAITDKAQFPYIPGLLSFREIPPLLKAFEKLPIKPDVVIVDGQGRAHPRRCGIASHLGLVLDLPTIGCAKSRLTGKYTEPCSWRGSASDLIDEGEVIGSVLRTRDDVAALFVSVGHKISLDAAIALVLQCAPRYRLPETTRQAHRLVNELRSSKRELNPS